MSDCYAMVRGRAIRVTALTARGRPGDDTGLITYATSKSVASVRVNEVVDQGGTDILSNDDDVKRIRLTRPTRNLRYTVDVDFTRVDPSMLSLITGVPVVTDASGRYVGFDSGTRLRPANFALEVWTKLAGQQCEDGQQAWGYTLFPFLAGGRVGGFRFSGGLVSFNLTGAKTRRGSRWAVGPMDLEGPYERLTKHVSGNASFRQTVIKGLPPAQADGTWTVMDSIRNGTATNPMPDPTAVLSVNGGNAASAGPYIISGGRAR